MCSKGWWFDSIPSFRSGSFVGTIPSSSSFAAWSSFLSWLPCFGRPSSSCCLFRLPCFWLELGCPMSLRGTPCSFNQFFQLLFCPVETIQWYLGMDNRWRRVPSSLDYSFSSLVFSSTDTSTALKPASWNFLTPRWRNVSCSFSTFTCPVPVQVSFRLAPCKITVPFGISRNTCKGSGKGYASPLVHSNHW